MDQEGVPVEIREGREFILNWIRNNICSEQDVGFTCHYIHNNCPMVHAEITIVSDDGKKTLQEKFHIENGFIIKRRSMEQLPDYAWVRCVDIARMDPNENLYQFATASLCKNHFRKIYELIVNKATKPNWSVQCYIDGNIENSSEPNVMKMHICDVLMIKFLKNNDLPIDLNIASGLLPNSVKLQNMKDLFFDHFITNESDRDFVLHMTDFWYVVFAYFHDYSAVPIRIAVPDHYRVAHSFKINKNAFFQEHQEYKKSQLSYALRNTGWQRRIVLLD